MSLKKLPNLNCKYFFQFTRTLRKEFQIYIYLGHRKGMTDSLLAKTGLKLIMQRWVLLKLLILLSSTLGHSDYLSWAEITYMHYNTQMFFVYNAVLSIDSKGFFFFILNKHSGKLTMSSDLCLYTFMLKSQLSYVFLL